MNTKKVFVLTLVVVLFVSLMGTTALAAKIPSAEDYRKTRSIKLKVAENIRVIASDGNWVKLRRGTTVKGYRFSENLAYVKLPNGQYSVMSTHSLRTVCGKKIPKLPTKVELKRSFRLEGEVLEPGTVLDVQFYAFHSKGFLMAYCYEGYIPTKYLNKK